MARPRPKPGRAPVNPTNTLGTSSKPRSTKSYTAKADPSPSSFPPRRNPTRAVTVWETDLSEDTDGIVTQVRERRRIRAPRDVDVFMSGALGPGDWSRKPTTAEEKHAMKAQREKDDKAQREAEKRFKAERAALRKERKDREAAAKAEAKEEAAAQKLKDKLSKTSTLNHDPLSVPLVDEADSDSSSINAPPIQTVEGSIAKPKATPLGPTTLKRRKRASSIFSPDRDEEASRMRRSPGINSSYLGDNSKFGGTNGILGNNDSEIERHLALELEMDETFMPDQVSASPFVTGKPKGAITNGDVNTLKRKLSPSLPLGSPTTRSNTNGPIPPSSPPVLHPRSVTPFTDDEPTHATNPPFNALKSPLAPALRPQDRLSPAPPESSPAVSPSPRHKRHTSLPAPSSPTQPRKAGSHRITKPRAAKQTKKKALQAGPTTATLQSLLPKRRRNVAARDHLLRSTSVPVENNDTSLMSHDDADTLDLDETPASSPTIPATKTRSSTTTKQRGRSARSASAALKDKTTSSSASTTKTTTTTARTTYSRLSGTPNGLRRSSSDKENQATNSANTTLLDAEAEEEEDASLFELKGVGNKKKAFTTKKCTAANGGGGNLLMRKIKEKFDAVDEWSLEFEEASPNISLNEGGAGSQVDAR